MPREIHDRYTAHNYAEYQSALITWQEEPRFRQVMGVNLITSEGFLRLHVANIKKENGQVWVMENVETFYMYF